MNRVKIVVLDRDTLGDDVPLDALYALGDVTVYGLTAPELVEERIANADVV